MMVIANVTLSKTVYLSPMYGFCYFGKLKTQSDYKMELIALIADG